MGKGAKQGDSGDPKRDGDGRKGNVGKLNSALPKSHCRIWAMKLGQELSMEGNFDVNVLCEPTKPQPNVLTTLHHNINIGIDPTRTTVLDSRGRPHYLVDSGVKPIPELIG
ncbi:MAG: hypothetical protein ACI8UO_005593 [Verrucomicrobiales bacterium]|jgi:hypothetical protein